MNTDFTLENDELATAIQRRIEKILLSPDRISKHRPWTWVDEDTNEHLTKAARHIMTHMMIESGYAPPDGECHLDNAACRLAMAIAQISRNTGG